MNQVPMRKHTWIYVAMIVGVTSLLIWAPGVDAKSSKKGRSTKGLPKAVAKAPVCDIAIHPKITKVTPDTVKPGQKIKIKGKNFGKKACFQKVSFGSTNAKKFRYVDDHTVEVTVPKMKPGLRPVNIMTAGGSSEFILLIKK